VEPRRSVAGGLGVREKPGQVQFIGYAEQNHHIGRTMPRGDYVGMSERELQRCMRGLAGLCRDGKVATDYHEKAGNLAVRHWSTVARVHQPASFPQPAPDGMTQSWVLKNLFICGAVLLIPALALSVADSWRYDGWQFIGETLRETLSTAVYGCFLPLGALALWGYGLAVVYLFGQAGRLRSWPVRLALFLAPTALTALSDQLWPDVVIVVTASAYALGFRLPEGAVPRPAAS
jgi:hypothetical protein